MKNGIRKAERDSPMYKCSYYNRVFYRALTDFLNIFILIFTMDIGLTFSNYDPLRVLDSLFTSINLI